jgi:hypothetical protein
MDWTCTDCPTTVVSRWLVMPTHATLDAAAPPPGRVGTFTVLLCVKTPVRSITAW